MIEVTEKPIDGRINQGDVLANVELVEFVKQDREFVDVSIIRFPFVVVLTQDCDLHQDSRTSEVGHTKENMDKWILSVLVAPIFNIEHVYKGIHMGKIGVESRPIKRDGREDSYLRTNQNPRYHFLDFPPGLIVVPSVIDFKNYFSVTVDVLVKIKQENYVCSINPLYREDISQRFASFLSRIGLPDQVN